MKFSEMTYTRPDINALLARCKQLAAKAADAQDGDALIQVYYEQSRAFADYTTASQLANIHYTCDTRDAYWKAEQDFFDANGPAVSNASVEISRAFLANPHVDALTEAFGSTCVAGMKNAVLGMDDRTVELQQEFNALVSQYQQIYGGALVELDGKQLTIPQLGPYKEDLDPAVRRAAYEAEAGYFDAHRDELDTLYTKIVKNLNQQAKVLGYKDYSELSYVRMNRIGLPGSGCPGRCARAAKSDGHARQAHRHHPPHLYRPAHHLQGRQPQAHPGLSGTHGCRPHHVPRTQPRNGGVHRLYAGQRAV